MAKAGVGNQTALDSQTAAVAVEGEGSAMIPRPNVLPDAVNILLEGYYHGMQKAIIATLALRAVAGSAVIWWLLKLWRRRKASRL